MRLLVLGLALCACACSRRDAGDRERGRPTRDVPVVRVDDLPPQLRAAFAPDGFTPLGPPAPGDWRAAHPEPEQTFDGFVASGPHRPTDARRTIYVVALGGGAKTQELLPTIIDYGERFFGLPTRELPGLALDAVRPTQRDNPYTGERQLLTTDILDYLRRHLPDDAYCLIAFTEIDLYPDPSWNFVFGQASLTDRVGVWSVARYADPDPLVARERALKIMAHEIGHMFGLAHCGHYACVMNGANNLPESDRAPHHLCPVCLRKLQWSTAFDPAARYRQLEDFYRREGLVDEADFVAARRAAIR
jgi:archaemetzincin